MTTKPNHSINYIWRKPLQRLFHEVDIASIVLFRICFGVIMLVEVFRYFDKGWIARYWIDAQYNFPYWPFHFLKPLDGDGMYYLFIFMGILSVFIIIGFLYRISTILFFFSFTYMFLLEQTRYLNHFYLIVLLSLVLCFIPAHRSLSVDAKLFKGLRSEKIPLWCLWLLRLMIAIPFFYGGLAKINTDWLSGQPLGIWLDGDTDFPIIGPYFTELWMIMLISYGGLLLDLLIAPFLLFKRTRIWAFLAGMLFHLMNARLFIIGIFPWFMICATTLFFKPSWPRTLVNRLAGKDIWPAEEHESAPEVLTSRQKRLIWVLAIWALVMLLSPLRHYLIPGNANWTEEGHKFSWHMKLRTKKAKGKFYVKAKDGSFVDTIRTTKLMPRWQRRKLLARPQIAWLFVQQLKEEYKAEGHDVEIYARIRASLNGREYQLLIDPEVDLAAEPYPVWKADWIVPLTKPLHKR
ncbi:MAG: HTTM domain-containing protein [Flavobacteriaceae bacterium]|nr:HTTM domain-containing protein [Flavobacteriaceae bacterium]